MKRPILNVPLLLEEPKYVEDGAGGVTEEWQELGMLWGALGGASGRETTSNGVGVARASLKVTVRSAPYGAQSRPNERQRFRMGDRSLRIISVSEADAAGKFLSCNVVEELSA